MTAPTMGTQGSAPISSDFRVGCSSSGMLLGTPMRMAEGILNVLMRYLHLEEVDETCRPAI